MGRTSRSSSGRCGRKLEGFLVVDKPEGWTSHDVVAWVRRKLKVGKVGHTGTLDPSATGVLVLALGQATKFIPFLDESEKEYIVTLRLGVTTDTDDAEGRVVGTCEVPDGLTREDFEEVCRRFEGDILQRPPAFSAVHYKGRRSYELARAGQSPELPPRRVRIGRIEVLDFRPPSVRLKVVCSKGTYIRALVRDVGEALGCGAHVEALVRTRSGPFRQEGAVPLDDVPRLASEGNLPLVPVGEALGLPEVELPCEEARSFLHGGRVPGKQEGRVAVYSQEGWFLGVGEGREGRIRPLRVVSL